MKVPPPLMNNSYAALGWCHRAANAVGSDRFPETVRRAAFYVEQVSRLATTPGERSILAGLAIALDELVIADVQARQVLADSVSGMNAAEATEFVELVESGEEDIPLF